jgi:hypothetical protein
MHKDLVVERHQNVQQRNKSSFILIDSMEEMNIAELAAHCAREIDSYRRGEPTDEEYSVGLLRLAIVQGEPEAWKSIQQCFGELISSWLRYHPQWKIAIKLGCQDQYIALTFKRFKQMITLNQPIEFESLAEAFTYLRVCLNGVILDTLRYYSC